MEKRTYPYIVARDRGNRWEYYLTIKPSKRVYLQGISKKRLKIIKHGMLSKTYSKAVKQLQRGHLVKPILAKAFYQSVFGDKAIATQI